MRNLKYKILLFIFLCNAFFLFCTTKSTAAPDLVNYYLGIVQDDQEFIAKMARFNVLIFTPAQIAGHERTIASIKQRNPRIVILAYVPSQSYNYQYWPNDLVFKNIRVQDSWWLRDASGGIVSTWTGIRNTNMDPEWSRYLVDFTNAYVMTLKGVDGIFFDMVSEDISWANGGNIDLNRDGVVDSKTELRRQWIERTTYFLKYAHDHIQTNYIIINGSSQAEYQPFIHGRMYESFPTPWERGGEWAAIMNSVVKNKQTNQKPQMILFNSNTNNTGNSADYRLMRYGITSSLLQDNVYYSFDHGDQNHGQTWWYDEYEVNLGKPLAAAVSQTNSNNFKPDVWRRDYEHGLTLVNSTDSNQEVDLGGDYEKIHGTQDKTTNDGSIVSHITVGEDDGVILLKAISSLNDVLFRNGDFVRFFRSDGSRVRNGFFLFEDGYNGGDKIAHIDLDGDNIRDLLVVQGSKIIAFRSDGQPFFKLYPYTVNYNGELRVAIGDLNNDGKKELYVAPSAGYPAPIQVYTLYGEITRDNWYPFGKKYTGGYSLAVGNLIGGGVNQLILGAGKDAKPSVYIYDYTFGDVINWLAFEPAFKGGVNVASGDVDGNGIDEVIVGAGKGKKPIIKIFNTSGKLLYPEFTAYSALNTPGIEVLSADVDFDGKDDVIGESGGL